MKKKKPPRFRALLESLIADGIYEIEVEYHGPELLVCVVRGSLGFGVASYRSEEDKRAADAIIADLRKKKSIMVGDKIYRLTFTEQENFHEPSWRIRIRESKQGSLRKK